MNSFIQGKNQIVKELIAKSEEDSVPIQVFSLFALFWTFVTTRTAEQKDFWIDILIGIPCLIMLCILFFAVCLL